MKPRALALAGLLACTPATPPSPAPTAPAPTRAVAITIDDLVVGGRDLDGPRLEIMTTRILEHITAGQVPVVAFVNADKLRDGAVKQARLALLRRWTAAGVELGNHTFSHPSLQDTPLADYQADVLRGEPEIRDLDAEHGWALRYFRHPYLRTGPTMAVREAFERFLGERGYTVAPVTIDDADWLFNFIYTDAKTRGDTELMRRVGAAFMVHMADVLTFYENAADAMFARPIDHILLLHANELGADYLDDVIALYRDRGYRFVTLEQALADPAYRERDGFVGPVGVSWLQRWDVTRGRNQVDWSAHPGIEPWVQTAFDAAQRGSD